MQRRVLRFALAWALLPSILPVAALEGQKADSRSPSESPAPAHDRERDYLRPTLEVGAILAFGLGVYFYKGDRNEYDAGLGWDRVEERFTTLRHFRFDDNEFAMNNVAHPLAGAMYYGFARENGFGPLGSTLFSLAGSTFWEVVVEIREVASLNDLLVTPATGLALGEALHQHRRFFRRSRRSWQSSLLEKLFGSPTSLDRIFGGAAPEPAAALDAEGHPADQPHRFRFHGGPLLLKENVPLGLASGSSWMTTLGVSSEIASVDAGDDGGARETGGLPLTRLELHVSFTDMSPTEMYLGAETVLGGWRGGEIRETDGRLRGHRWTVGPTTGLTTRLDHIPDTRFMGLFAAAHLLGLRTDWVIRRNRFRARWHGSVYGDFSSIRPLGFEGEAEQGLPLPLSNSVLSRNFYYYAWGGTLRSGVEVDLGPVGLRGEIDHHVFEAFRSRHRPNDHAHSDMPVRDTRTYVKAWLEFEPADGLRLAAGGEEWRGSGTVDDRTLHSRETRLLLRVVTDL